MPRRDLSQLVEARKTGIDDLVSVTVGGTYVTPLNLQPEQIIEWEVAHHLSQLCRFTGGTRRFYSVAEHSVRVSLAFDCSTLAGVELARWGLWHDGPEYILGDLARPVKHSDLGKLYRETEARAMAAFVKRIGLAKFDARVHRKGMPNEVKDVDTRMLLTERRDLIPNADEDPWWQPGDRLTPYRERITSTWQPEHAKWEFERRHRYLEWRRAEFLGEQAEAA